MSDEPIIHSHMDDHLPESHPSAHENVFCLKCKDMLHAFNNECMQTWVEVRGRPFCIACALPIFQDVLTYGPLREFLE